LGVVVKLVLAKMVVTRAKEPPIASRTAIRVLKHHKVTEPIGDALSSRSEELFATAMWTAGDLRLRSGFLHGKSSAGATYVTTFGGLNRNESSALKSGRL
jgi:hypothetical protein